MLQTAEVMQFVRDDYCEFTELLYWSFSVLQRLKLACAILVQFMRLSGWLK